MALLMCVVGAVGSAARRADANMPWCLALVTM